jgi:protein KTI12
MPCVLIICGLPLSGKTELANKIQERALLLRHADNVTILNESTVVVGKSLHEYYATSQAEKSTRAALKAALDRAISNASAKELIVLDSLNYIKGFRYELYCLSKAANVRHAVVWVVNDSKNNITTNSQQWSNPQVSSNDSKKLIQELGMRFERPDERNRWDNPLYKISMRDSDQQQQQHVESQNTPTTNLQQQESVYNMHGIRAAAAAAEVANEKDPTESASAAIQQQKQNQQPVPTKTSAVMFKRPGAGFKRAVKAELVANKDEPSRSPHNSNQPTDSCTGEHSKSSNNIIADATTTTSTQPQPQLPTQLRSLEDRVDAMLNSFFNTVRPLKQSTSTLQHESADADVLHRIDSITNQLCSSMAQQQQQLHQPSELRQLRKQYLRWVTTYPPVDVSEAGITKSFLAYIETHPSK